MLDAQEEGWLRGMGRVGGQGGFGVIRRQVRASLRAVEKGRLWQGCFRERAPEGYLESLGVRTVEDIRGKNKAGERGVP